jgi:NAD(P)-dependent dehydrogenase (short-subunit alcohol dehydrogenase family)
MGRLDGKVALITGTGGGQGRAAAEIFAREGAKIVGCDLKVEGNQETRRLVEAEGGTMIGLEPLDLTDAAEARRFVDTALEAFGAIDILYNNASAQRFSPFPDITPEDWRFTINNDLEIVFPVTQYAWPHLIERGGGSIIITSSGAALRGGRTYPTVAHAAAKGGVLGFARALAAEGLAHKIRVNSIAPGLIETPVLKEHLDDAMRELLASQVPIGRIGLPEDIAYYALFLASDESTFVTGTVLPIDGGAANILM